VRAAHISADLTATPAVEHHCRILLCSAGELWGGVERFIELFARALRRHGVAPAVCVFSDGLLRQRLRDNGVDVEVSPIIGKYDPRIVGWLTSVLRRGRFTLLHTHGYKAAVVGGLASALAGVPMVHTLHGLQEPSRGRERAKMAANFAAEQLFARRRASHTVAVSRDLFDRLSLGRWGDRASVIHNGIEPFQVHRSDMLDGLQGATSTRLRIGIVGRIVPVKGHGVLLRAVARLRELDGIQVYVFGEGPGEAKCRELAATLGIESRVHFLGFKPDVHRYLAALDVLAMPSIHEGLPYVLLEALYSGVTVVCSAVGGLKEVITDGLNGLLVAPGDEESFASALRRLHDSDVLRQQLGTAGRELARTEFLIDATVARYLDVFERIRACPS
jgi:L-malate glycosyltransferase